MSTLVISGDTSGTITVQAASSGTGTVTLPLGSGTLITTPVILPAGTSTTAPLSFQSGTILSSASAGNFEYDGKLFYLTPSGAQRGLAPTQITYYLNSALTGTNDTSVQSIFGVSVSLSANTVYDIEARIQLLASGSTNSVTLNLGFGGTSTLNNIMYQTQSVWDAGATNTQVDTTENMAIVNTSAQTATTVAAATGAYGTILRGTLSVATAGTFTPQYQWSGTPGSAWSTQPGSYFSLYPIGTAGANLSIGTWS
jgi:hypothetical protein